MRILNILFTVLSYFGFTTSNPGTKTTRTSPIAKTSTSPVLHPIQKTVPPRRYRVQPNENWLKIALTGSGRR